MSRRIFWNELEIMVESIDEENECRLQYDKICFNNLSKSYGKICHGCDKFIEEDNKVEPYWHRVLFNWRGKDVRSRNWKIRKVFTTWN